MSGASRSRSSEWKQDGADDVGDRVGRDGAGAAQPDYPTRPVRVAVPFAAGGVVDVMARVLTQKLTATMGASFYVDNIGGAGGNIGTARAAASAKDGYTIEITSSSFVVNPSLHARPTNPRGL